jgi:hypothetical protein
LCHGYVTVSKRQSTAAPNLEANAAGEVGGRAMLNDLIVGRAILGSHRNRFSPRHAGRLRAWLRHVMKVLGFQH